ncbi:hypothetical protein IWQ57_004397, partial [Coemansia nantahalensis]
SAASAPGLGPAVRPGQQRQRQRLLRGRPGPGRGGAGAAARRVGVGRRAARVPAAGAQGVEAGQLVPGAQRGGGRPGPQPVPVADRAVRRRGTPDDSGGRRAVPGHAHRVDGILAGGGRVAGAPRDPSDPGDANLPAHAVVPADAAAGQHGAAGGAAAGQPQHGVGVVRRAPPHRAGPRGPHPDHRLKVPAAHRLRLPVADPGLDGQPLPLPQLERAQAPEEVRPRAPRPAGQRRLRGRWQCWRRWLRRRRRPDPRRRAVGL